MTENLTHSILPVLCKKSHSFVSYATWQVIELFSAHPTGLKSNFTAKQSLLYILRFFERFVFNVGKVVMHWNTAVFLSVKKKHLQHMLQSVSALYWGLYFRQTSLMTVQWAQKSY